MFYEPRQGHGLPHDPFKALVVPRPIGWITSRSAGGALNLAPYSFFNAFSSSPPIVGFSSNVRKDSVSFIEETGEFVCNLATYDLREAVNASSAPLPRGMSEFDFARLEVEPSRLVAPPRVKGVAAALECRLLKTVGLADLNGDPVDSWVVLGQVVGVHIDDRFIKDGIVDTAAMRPIARLGYYDYSVVDETFVMKRPARP